MTNRDSFADKFHSALDRLKNTTKLVLLHHLSTQLKKNVGNHPLLMRFHMLAMTLEANTALMTALSLKDDGAMKMDDTKKGRPSLDTFERKEHFFKKRKRILVKI